jgi:uncharacterized glyoxalase superfamily protein PhnB
MRRTAELPGLSLSFTVLEAATIERLFAALAAGGQMRLTTTFFAPRFGVSWMVTVAS